MSKSCCVHGEQAPAKVSLDWSGGKMMGQEILRSERTLGNLNNIFRNEVLRATLDPGQKVYDVQWWAPVDAGTDGGLFWGVTVIHPGRVGDEYFMTHGHFHVNRTRAEYYATVSGNGMLILMDDERHTWGEQMKPGTLHYIDGRYAHRVANTGDMPLIFSACWPSDAGYDYGTIAQRGFGARLVEQNGEPAFLSND